MENPMSIDLPFSIVTALYSGNTIGESSGMVVVEHTYTRNVADTSGLDTDVAVMTAGASYPSISFVRKDAVRLSPCISSAATASPETVHVKFSFLSSLPSAWYACAVRSKALFVIVNIL